MSPCNKGVVCLVTQGCFLPRLAEICLVVLKKKKMWKVCDNDYYDDNNDDDADAVVIEL